MFKYPSGRTLMNGVIWLFGALQFLTGILLVLAGLAIDLTVYLPMAQITQLSPELGTLLTGGSLFIGLLVIVSSFPSLMFAEMHVHVTQTNKMMKKMYEKIK
jgi:hypothetical protein